MDDALLATFLDHQRARGLAPASVRLRAERLGPAIAWFRAHGVLTPAALRPADVEGFLAHLIEGGRRRETVKSYRTSLRAFGRWLAATGTVLTDPTADLETTRTEDDGELPPDPLSQEEMAQLIAAIPTDSAAGLRNCAHVELVYGCGLRLAESIGLDLDDVDLDGQAVTVLGKGAKVRTLPLLPGVVSALRDYLALRRTLLRGPDRGHLFIGTDGERLRATAFRQWFKGHAGRVLGHKRRVFPHLLRHSFAVHLLLGGADIRHVQALLGHASIDVTKVYLRLLPEQLRAAYEAAMPELLP